MLPPIGLPSGGILTSPMAARPRLWPRSTRQPLPAQPHGDADQYHRHRQPRQPPLRDHRPLPVIPARPSQLPLTHRFTPRPRITRRMPTTEWTPLRHVVEASRDIYAWIASTAKLKPAKHVAQEALPSPLTTFLAPAPGAPCPVMIPAVVLCESLRRGPRMRRSLVRLSGQTLSPYPPPGNRLALFDYCPEYAFEHFPETGARRPPWRGPRAGRDTARRPRRGQPNQTRRGQSAGGKRRSSAQQSHSTLGRIGH